MKNHQDTTTQRVQWLVEVAASLGEVPHLGEGVDRTPENFIEHVLSRSELSGAQEAYLHQLLLAGLIAFSGGHPSTINAHQSTASPIPNPDTAAS